MSKAKLFHVTCEKVIEGDIEYRLLTIQEFLTISKHMHYNRSRKKRDIFKNISTILSDAAPLLERFQGKLSYHGWTYLSRELANIGNNVENERLLEDIRIKNNPERISRGSSSFCTTSVENCEKFSKLFNRDRRTAKILETEVNTDGLFVQDMNKTGGYHYRDYWNDSIPLKDFIQCQDTQNRWELSGKFPEVLVPLPSVFKLLED